jgi:hypothetical protein
MKSLLIAATAVAAVHAASKPTDKCSEADIGTVTTCAVAVLGSQVNSLSTLTNATIVDGTIALFEGHFGTDNMTANFELFNALPDVMTVMANFNETQYTTEWDADQIGAFNTKYYEAACGDLIGMLQLVGTCVPKNCNETTWEYCSSDNITKSFEDGYAGASLPAPNLAVVANSVSKLVRHVCYQDSDDSKADSICSSKLFPTSKLGTHTWSPTASPTAASVSNSTNTTSAASGVEIAVLAAASVVATTVLAF